MTLTKWIYLLSLHKVFPSSEREHNSLHQGQIFLLLLSSADFFQNKLSKNYFRTLSECQTVWIQIRTKEILSWSRPKLLHWLSEQLALIMKKLQELFIKHKYILVLKIMSAAYFQMNLRLLLSWKQTLWIQIRLRLRELSNLDPYLSSLRLNPCGGHQTDL